jgi:hypothetical protein
VARCEYEETRKKAIIESLVEAAIKAYRKVLNEEGSNPNPNPGGDSTERRVIQLYERSLAYYGPLLKHHSFKEEKEWRAVLGPLPVPPVLFVKPETIDATWGKLKFRTAEGVMVPYCDLKYRTDAVPLSGRVVIMAGPSRMKDRGSHIFRAFVRRTFGDKASYSVSATPFDPL